MADEGAGRSTFLHELKRRHVFRIAIGYGVAAFAIAQVADIAIPALSLPPWTLTFIIFCLAIGFPLALVLAWAFDITPAGVKRTDALPGEEAVEDDRLPATGPETPPGARRPALTAVPRLAARPAAHRDPQTGPSLHVHPPLESASHTAPDPVRVERASLAQLRDELRTPATAIVDYSRTLLEEATAAGRETLRSDLEKIRTAGELFLSRLEDLLDPDHPTWDRTAPDREALLSRMRHDLRTPLNAILGYSELILEEDVDPAADEAIAGDIARILVAARQVSATIEEVVRFAATGKVEGAGMARASALAHEVLAKLRPLRADGGAIPLRQGRLLVVDDHEANRELIGHQLARQGYTVSAAASGREALEMVANDDFDLVLLDILMPDIDGVEVLRRLKADPSSSVIPVIVISALDEVDSVVRCIEMGAEDFVSKPFDPVLLGARIGTVLEVRRLRERERSHADALRREQQWIDRLLGRTFPAVIADKVRLGEPAILESSGDTTVLVAGFQGSAALTRGGPSAMVERLSELYGRFDTLAVVQGIETVKVTGQYYLAAAGIPTERPDHAHIIADLALALHEETRRFADETNELLRLRVGIHTGPAAAGIFAIERLAFDVWGDAVDTAQQLQLHASAGTTQVSPTSYARLRDAYAFVSRGVVDVPGKGQMRTYLLQGRAEAAPATPAQ